MNPRQFEIPVRPKLAQMLLAACLVGAGAFLLGLLLAPQRAWANLLLVSYYLLGLGLGATFFVALLYICGAGWAVALRRIPEAMTAILPFAAAGLGLVFVLGHAIYPWTHPADHSAHALSGFKAAWLSLPFFVVRAAIFLLLWIAIARALVRNSRRQDADGDLSHTFRNVRLAAVFMVVFAATYWLASFDWVMSLEPHWYSTIFGIYNFAGLFLAALAVITLLAVWLSRLGPLRSLLTDEHLHDLGKLMLAFSVFWAYIWFSQYMLVWYANIPEESGYYVLRQSGNWGPLLVVNLFLNWVIPFFALLPKPAKRSPGTMVKVAVVLLVGRWLDLHIMIMPAITGARVPFGPLEIAMAAGAACLFALVFLRSLRSAPVVPMHDPRLVESLHYHG